MIHWNKIFVLKLDISGYTLTLHLFYKEMMVEVKKTAREITKNVKVDETREAASEDTDEDDDDDFIGPPIPTGNLLPTLFVCL